MRRNLLFCCGLALGPKLSQPTSCAPGHSLLINDGGSFTIGFSLIHTEHWGCKRNARPIHGLPRQRRHDIPSDNGQYLHAALQHQLGGA